MEKFMIIQDALAGFLLGLSLIIAIGAQNVFVIHQGLKRYHVLTVCSVCAASDAVLILAGVWMFQEIQALGLEVDGTVVRVAGAAILIVYGLFSAKQVVWPAEQDTSFDQNAMTRRTALLTCLGLSLLNPWQAQRKQLGNAV